MNLLARLVAAGWSLATEEDVHVLSLGVMRSPRRESVRELLALRPGVDRWAPVWSPPVELPVPDASCVTAWEPVVETRVALSVGAFSTVGGRGWVQPHYQKD